MTTPENPTPEQYSSPSTSSGKANQQPGLLANLLFNIVIPTLILTKLSGDDWLGTKLALVVALLFPIGYGIRDFHSTRKVNFFSALGFISVLLTGGIGLFELDPAYIAIKEAAIPALFGLATMISLKTPWPLVRTFIYNDTILETERIATALKKNHSTEKFEARLITASWLIAGSFFLSSALNYILAVTIITGQPGSVEFNEQLGKMTALSFPVIAIPCMLVMMGAMFYLFKGITQLTGLALDDVVRHKN